MPKLLLGPVVAMLVGCGGAPKSTQGAPVRPHLVSAADQILPLLPEGAQVIVELDLARLRANPVIGAVVTQALADGTFDALPLSLPSSPLAHADTVVLAAYGVGTAQAATVTVLATKDEVPGGVRLADGLVALGPQEWTAQLEARAALATVTGSAPAIVTSAELLALRDHAMPAAAPGAALRITARLPFDARIALARQTGLGSAPAQLSVWGDVVDDLVVIVDTDATDPGDRRSTQPIKRMELAMRNALRVLAGEPAVRALGIPASLADAHLVARGSWLRTIIAIGPAHLHRVVERATALLAPGAPS